MNIPETSAKRIVIIGVGFAGLQLAQSLKKSNYQVVLIDRNNFYQFQPLLYQVATAGLEPSSISFPLRKIFQGFANIHIRVTQVLKIDTNVNQLETELGTIKYDYLVLAMGCTSFYFGNENIKKHALPMKSVSESLALRNKILQNLEDALTTDNEEERASLMNIVVVGGGPTGVEISGTLAEMKKQILPKDYPELDFSKMNITLIEGSAHTLNVMADVSKIKSQKYLEKLGVEVILNTQVKDYDGEVVTFGEGKTIKTKNLIWAAGVIANKIEGLKPEVYERGNRIAVDEFNKIKGYDNIFALGDVALLKEEAYPNGHPQLAQPAMQQGKNLALNFINDSKGKAWKPFKYTNLGTMATVGRNLAVVEFPFLKLQGFIAWLIWMFVHLMSIVGVKNRLLIFINWCWNYLTYDQSLRLILKPKEK